MFTEDLDVFFNVTTGFALAATLQGGATVNVIFDREYLEQLGIAGTAPMAVCQAGAVVAGDVGKTLTIAGTAYTIKGREPIDDGAIVRLTLKV